MEFRILGPLEVIEDGQALDLGGQKQQVLLAVLLLHANEVVSSDRLIDALWPERPPGTAAKALQVYVSKLRKSVGRDRLRTKPPGYVLDVAAGELDLDRCRRLAEDGKPEEALALWRGPALSEFAYLPFAQPDLARLEELRLGCLEDRVEADLASGRHAGLVGELEGLVAEHPLREGFRAQLMLALYRSGRQAEALEIYQAGRRLLADELGLEPGEALKRLQRSILEHDPALDLSPPQPVEPAAGHPASASVDAGEQREVRKTVTVLFASLESADGAEAIDPEAQRRLTSRALAEVVAAVESHGGTIEAVAGEAVTAVFGVPVVHEDDALRALRAAANLRFRLASLRDEPGTWAGRLDVRLALSTGEVVTGGPGTQLRSTGRPITAAARLGQAADTGAVLLDEATHRLVKDRVEVAPHEQGLLLLQLRSDGPVVRSMFRAPMVGRRREARRLRDAFEQAVGDRSCQLFTVLGAAGVGKSRLVGEFVAELGNSATVVGGRCLPYGKGITYFPLTEAVREAAGIEDADAPEEGLARIAAVLAGEEDTALLARRIGELMGLVEVGVGPHESFAAVRALFEALARRKPLVVVFDDIHWGEPTFLDLVEYLGDWMRDAPALIAAVARPDLLDVRPGWAGGKLNATTVLLEPLSEDESAQLLDSLGGAGRVSDETRGRIVAAAEGNPLFVEEMLALVLEDGRADAEVEVPATIQLLLAARLDRLGDDERTVLEHAAVQGKEFYEAALLALVPERVRSNLSEALSSLVRKELIRPDRAALGGRTYRFRHLLIRDAAYDSIPKQSRAKLHDEFAAWFEGVLGARSTEYDDVVGYHYEQAYGYRTELGPVDDVARELGRQAAERLAAAGRRALVRSDAPGGSNLVSRAVALLRPEDPLRVELVPNQRLIQGMSGDLSWAERVLTEAVETAATTGDRRLAAHALVQRAFLRLFTGTGATAEELLDVAERAVVLFDELGDELGLARAWRLVAQAHYLARRGGQSAAASEQALVHVRRARDRFEEREVVEWLLVAHQLGPMPLPEAIERGHRLLAEIGSQPLLEALVLSTLATHEAARGRGEEAGRLLAEGRLALDEYGGVIPMFHWSSGVTRILTGDLELAESELRVGYDALRSMGGAGHFSALCVLLGEVSYRLGRYEEAGRFAREADRASRANDVFCQTSWRTTEAAVLARAGRFDDAERLADEALAFAAESDFLTAHARALEGRAEVLCLGDRADEAPPLLERAAAFYDQKGDLVSAAGVRSLLGAV